MVHSRPLSGRLLGTLCIAASLLGCIEEAQWETPADQTLVIALESSPRTFDPRFSIDSASSKISRLLFRSLVSVSNGSLAPELDLAQEAYPDPLDPSIWHIRLRREGTFHDGSPITGHDVAYTYNSVLDSSLGSPFQGTFQPNFASLRWIRKTPSISVFSSNAPMQHS